MRPSMSPTEPSPHCFLLWPSSVPLLASFLVSAPRETDISPQISEGPLGASQTQQVWGLWGFGRVEAHNAVMVKNRVSDRKPSS